MKRFLLVVLFAGQLLTLPAGCGRNKPTPAPTGGPNAAPETPRAAADEGDEGEGDAGGSREGASGEVGSPGGETPGDSESVPDGESSGSPVEREGTAASGSAAEALDAETAEAFAGLVADDPAVRDEAMSELEAAQAGEPVALGLPYTRHADPQVRRGAYFYLVDRFQASDATLVDAFSRALEDDDDTVRRMGLQVLRRMRQEDVVRAVPRIATLLAADRADEASRASMARLLGTLGAEAEAALPALERSLTEDPSERVRAASAFSLSEIAAAAQSAPQLGQVLRKDPAEQVRYVAAARLGRIADSPESAALAARHLAPGLADKSPKVEEAVAENLQRLGPAAVPALMEQLKAPELRTRKLAAVVLGRLGPAAKDAVAALQAAATAEDADQELKKLVQLVVARIQP